MAKLISKTYGEALYTLAIEENKVDEFFEEVVGVLEILLNNQEFSNLLNHPKIGKEEKEQVMENVFKGRILDELVGFFRLIIIKDRYSEMIPILKYFIAKIKEFKGIGIANVETALPLTEAQKKQIEEKLLETTSFQKMEMHYRVDSALIGGMVIRIGDRVVDSSIRTKLSELQKQLMHIQLK